MDAKEKQSEKGQAIFEFIVFAPLMVSLFAIFLTIVNAINGAINQQKVTRGYFYNIVQNDSMYPNEDVLVTYAQRGVTLGGIYAIGWHEDASGEDRFAPCYKILTMANIDGSQQEACKSEPNIGTSNFDGTTGTKFIRVKTVYGVCTGTFYLRGNFRLGSDTFDGTGPVGEARSASCLNYK